MRIWVKLIGVVFLNGFFISGCVGDLVCMIE